MIRAGSLDRVLVIERVTRTTGRGGEIAETWAPLHTIRAGIVMNAVDEAARDPGLSTDDVLTFRARFLDDITTADRIVYRGAVHDIVSLTEIGRRQGLTIRCKTRAA